MIVIIENRIRTYYIILTYLIIMRFTREKKICSLIDPMLQDTRASVDKNRFSTTGCIALFFFPRALDKQQKFHCYIC